MSGEFGEYGAPGYFHTKVQSAAEDCEQEGHGEVTKLMGALLRALAPVAHDISWYEAADSGPAAPLIALIEQTPEIERAWKAMKEHAEPYRQVAATAVRRAVVEAEAEQTAAS